jgi:hypothetical protein
VVETERVRASSNEDDGQRRDNNKRGVSVCPGFFSLFSFILSYFNRISKGKINS